MSPAADPVAGAGATAVSPRLAVLVRMSAAGRGWRAAAGAAAGRVRRRGPLGLAVLCGLPVLGYALVGDAVLAELLPGPQDAPGGGLPRVVLVLAPAVASAPLSAGWPRGRFAVLAAGLGAAALWAGGHAAAAVLLAAAVPVAGRGARRAAAFALAAAGAAELLAVALASGSWLPGCERLGRPVAALVAAHGLAAVPVLACGAAAAGLLCHTAVRH
ncbi:hypothetical protein [Streptomyces sp. NBC_01803]|uniref:hypothetical protein n=1 Tax=Streptomyces sp. NBC_01803 TaxID=2975946 RepID=UPI002DD7DCAF|nr:hypothetical protein [Streptomyces sp. NBC_01803]WSA46039.1 hypothetical protein OIE51_18645 [Streptomyces sp. NBC_01803]